MIVEFKGFWTEERETERLSYGFISEEQALKRFRNEQANFNKRSKLRVKNGQRTGNKQAGVADGEAEESV